MFLGRLFGLSSKKGDQPADVIAEGLKAGQKASNRAAFDRRAPGHLAQFAAAAIAAHEITSREVAWDPNLAGREI